MWDFSIPCGSRDLQLDVSSDMMEAANDLNEIDPWFLQYHPLHEAQENVNIINLTQPTRELPVNRDIKKEIKRNSIENAQETPVTIATIEKKKKSDVNKSTVKTYVNVDIDKDANNNRNTNVFSSQQQQKIISKSTSVEDTRDMETRLAEFRARKGINIPSSSSSSTTTLRSSKELKKDRDSTGSDTTSTSSNTTTTSTVTSYKIKEPVPLQSQSVKSKIIAPPPPPPPVVTQEQPAKSKTTTATTKSSTRLKSKTSVTTTALPPSSSSSTVPPTKSITPAVEKVEKIEIIEKKVITRSRQSIRQALVVEAEKIKIEEDNMRALLKQHNSKFVAASAYEPPRHSVRDVRKWERQTGRIWAKLGPQARELANKEIDKMKLNLQS